MLSFHERHKNGLKEEGDTIKDGSKREERSCTGNQIQEGFEKDNKPVEIFLFVEPPGLFCLPVRFFIF